MDPILEAVSKFDNLVSDIQANNSREHKRLTFSNKNVANLEMLEHNLRKYFALNMSTEQMNKFEYNLADCGSEVRICECLLELIKHAEKRIDASVEMIKSIRQIIRQVQVQAHEQQAESMVTRCSLLIYDSFQFLVTVKRIIAEVCAIYQVPYYYNDGKDIIRIRASLHSTFNNLNITIDDLQTICETLWLVRNYDALADGN